jgi:hypothetical protein
MLACRYTKPQGDSRYFCKAHTRSGDAQIRERKVDLSMTTGKLSLVKVPILDRTLLTISCQSFSFGLEITAFRDIYETLTFLTEGHK